MRQRLCALLFALAFCASAVAQDRNSTPRIVLSPAEIASLLKQGGYVLYFRHAATDFSQNDTQSRGPRHCARQRNLTDAGRADARAIGTAITSIDASFVRVVASPTCRTMETANLVFGRAEASEDVRGGPIAAPSPERYEPLLRLMSTPLPEGQNLGIASHGNPFYALVGPPYLAEGELALIKPGGAGFEVIAQVRVGEWKAVQNALK